MAIRPVFVALDSYPFVKVEDTEFKFYPGFSLSQARKSSFSLRDSFVEKHSEYSGLVLEVSSKSDSNLGTQLSAFNLLFTLSDGRKRTIESVFQSGKCFSNGKQYVEIIDLPSAEAKKYGPLRTSGEITHFKLENTIFPTSPITLFYDWIYINALIQNPQLASSTVIYRAFTDIAFNPKKSLNCQARSVALYVALSKAGVLNEATKSPEAFQKIVFQARKNEGQESFQQLSMF